MIELPEIKSLTEREQALMLIVKGNPDSMITHLHYENSGDFVCCYCIFEHEPSTVVDFSDEFTLAFGSCVLGNYRAV